MAKFMYRVLEPGGLIFGNKHYLEHREYDLLADGWKQADINAAVSSGIVAQGQQIEEPKKDEEKSISKKKVEDKDNG